MRETRSTLAQFIESVSASFRKRARRLPAGTGVWQQNVFFHLAGKFSIALACLCSFIFTALVLVFAPAMREGILAISSASRVAPGGESVRSREADGLRKRIRNLEQQYESFTPRKPYLIVDTSNNRFQLMTGKTIIRQGTCSTGSYIHLQAGDNRQWVFKTPRGRFHVQMKEKSPVWCKPDWAFIEEGLPVPAPSAPERFESGVLGEYALHIGNSYLIHGTLYKRLLGMPVTHGCVRLDDEDLETVYMNLKLGSAVYIY